MSRKVTLRGRVWIEITMTIGIYPRKSVYRDNSESVSVQIQLCKDYAGILYKDQDITFRVYDRDEGFSGKNTNRPSFQELMADVKAGCLDIIMVYKLDRISRNVQEFSEMFSTFQRYGVSFVSVKESFDTNTPIGRTVMYILAAFAQLERENTSERVSDNMRALGAAGMWTGGRRPAGMTSIRKRIDGKEHSFLMVDPDSIGLVKSLYRLLLDGYSLTGAERYCRDHGIRTKAGKYLSSNQIYQIIINPVYCANDLDAYYYLRQKGHTLPDQRLFDGANGLIAYGRTSSTDKNVHNHTWTIAIGIHEPVLSGKEWTDAQARLGHNKMYRSNKYESGILKGVLRCRCGSRIDIRTYTKNGLLFSYYYCAAAIRKGHSYCNSGYARVDKIDRLFRERLHQIRIDPSLIILRQDEPQAVADTGQMQEELSRLDQSIHNLTAALMEHSASSAASYIIAQIEQLDAQKRQLEYNLQLAELSRQQAENAARNRETVYQQICTLLENFDDLSYLQKNEFIKKMVKTCTLDGETLDIMF